MAKLDGYAQWMREDPRVIGLMNWHWDTYHFCCPKAPSSDLYFWGVTSMPSVRARLVELSKEFGLKTDDSIGSFNTSLMPGRVARGDVKPDDSDAHTPAAPTVLLFKPFDHNITCWRVPGAALGSC